MAEKITIYGRLAVNGNDVQVYKSFRDGSERYSG